MAWTDVATLPGFALIRGNETWINTVYHVEPDGEIVITAFTGAGGGSYVPNGVLFTFDGDTLDSFSALQLMPIHDEIYDQPEWAETFNYVGPDCTTTVYLDHDDPSLGTWLDACRTTRYVGFFSTSANNDNRTAEIRFRLRAEVNEAPPTKFWTRNVNCSEHA